MGPRAGLDACGKSRPHRDSIPGPYRVAIPTALSLPASSVGGSKLVHSSARTRVMDVPHTDYGPRVQSLKLRLVNVLTKMQTI